MTIDLSRCWTKHDIALIDTETTGLSPLEGHAIVDVAAVRFRAGEVVARWSSFINPCRAIPLESTKIHGITQAMVEGAPTMAEAAAELLKVCDGAVPAAYNAAFDRGFIHAFIRGTECAAFDPSFPGWICQLVVVKDADRWVKGTGRHKLEATCKRWGVEMDGPAHRALTDATAAGHLLFRMLERCAIKPCPLGKLLAHIEKRRVEQDKEFQEYKRRQSA